MISAIQKIFGYKLFSKLLCKKVDPVGLAYFRIFYSIVLFSEVLQIFYFRHLIFDKIPYIEVAEVDFSIALIVWLGAILFLMFGYCTKYAAIINYILSLTFIATIKSFEYHMFYIYMSINFLLMFLEVNEEHSLDRFFSKKNPRKVSVLNYYTPLLVAIGFVYFDSALYKMNSPLWMSGLGVWLPSSVPFVSIFPFEGLLNFRSFSFFASHFVLFFEVFFIFCFFIKKLRIILFVIGVSLHVGIALTFPIPCFGFGIATIYLLLIPSSCWRRGREVRFAENVNEDKVTKKFIFAYFLLFLILILQFNVTIFGGNVLKRYVKVRPGVSYRLEEVSRAFWGITAHAVFIDGHFNGYNRYFAVRARLSSGEVYWLPIINEDGSPGKYNVGFNWAKWSFRVVSPDPINIKKFEEGVRDFTAFWLHKNKIDSEGTVFEILMREFDLPQEWTKDFLANERKKSWILVGSAYWESSEFIFNSKPD